MINFMINDKKNIDKKISLILLKKLELLQSQVALD